MDNIFLKILELTVQGQLNTPIAIVVVSGVILRLILNHYINVKKLNNETEQLDNNHEAKMYELETARKRLLSCPSMSLERMVRLRELVTNVMIKGFGVLLLCSVMITYTSTLVQAAVKYNQIMIPEDSDKGLRNVANLQKWRRDGI